MAKMVLKDANVKIATVDLSGHVSSVTIETARDEVDVTAMGAVNKETLAGLGDATITLEVYQDYAAAAVDATLFPLSLDDDPFVVEIKPTSAPTSATNPMYSMSGLLFSYSPIAGSVGEANTTTVTIKNASQAGLTRAVS